MPRPHNGRSVFIIVRTYAFAFGIWLTSDRFDVHPLDPEVRHRVQLHAEEARVILDIFHHHAGIAQRMGGLQLVAGSVISVTRLRTQVFSSSSSRRRSLVVPISRAGSSSGSARCATAGRCKADAR